MPTVQAGNQPLTVYVYFKTPAADEMAVSHALVVFMRGMLDQGYGCRVQRRCDPSSDGRLTWMEIYEGLHQGDLGQWRLARDSVWRDAGSDLYRAAEAIEVFSEINLLDS